MVWVLLLYGIGVLLALMTRGKALGITGYICIIIVLLSFPFVMGLIGLAGAVGAAGGLGGAGLVYIGIVIAIFGLPALGFLVGWFAKLFLPKPASFFPLLNYSLVAIVTLGPALLFYANVVHPDMKSKAERELFRKDMKRESELKRKSKIDFFKNTGVPVKFGDNELVLPVRRDVTFGYYDLEQLKTKVRKGPVQTERLKIGGYNYHYLPPSDFPHASTSKSARNTPADCLLVENEKLFRCNFIKPEFNLTFREDSRRNYSERDKSSDPIRVIDEFDVIKEEWRKSKSKNEKPILMFFKLRDFSYDELNGLEIPNFTNCSSYGSKYKCTASINPINGRPKIRYEFSVTEATDIPMIIRRTRNIANEYWDELLRSHGVKEMDIQ